MLDANLKGQLKSYLANITQPIELVASLDEGTKSRELKELLDEIAELSENVSVATGNAQRKPSFMIKAVICGLEAASNQFLDQHHMRELESITTDSAPMPRKPQFTSSGNIIFREARALRAHERILILGSSP